MAAAFAGLVGLLLPGLSAPPLLGAVLMLAAGVALGRLFAARTRRGRSDARHRGQLPARGALRRRAFARDGCRRVLDARGAAFAVASGALASGVGYALWYSALKHLQAARARPRSS